MNSSFKKLKDGYAIVGVVAWPKFRKPNDQGKFTFEVTNFDKDSVKLMKSLGINVRETDKDPKKGWFITVKSNHAFDVVTKSLTKYTDEQANKLSTGTEVRFRAETYDTTYGKKNFTNVGVQKYKSIMVTKEVLWEASIADDDFYAEAVEESEETSQVSHENIEDAFFDDDNV